MISGDVCLSTRTVSESGHLSECVDWIPGCVVTVGGRGRDGQTMCL